MLKSIRDILNMIDNYSLLSKLYKNIARVICLKAVCSVQMPRLLDKHYITWSQWTSFRHVWRTSRVICTTFYQTCEYILFNEWFDFNIETILWIYFLKIPSVCLVKNRLCDYRQNECRNGQPQYQLQWIDTFIKGKNVPLISGD